MAELSKYEILLNELGSVESQVSILISKYKDSAGLNIELENALAELQKENQLLSQRILKLETELDKLRNQTKDQLLEGLNSKEKESVKGKIENLISKIDYHLSADR